MAAPVILHIYDVGGSSAVSGLNKGLSAMGTGAFHGGVEVYGTEWSFGGCDSGTGVFDCPPKGCDVHKYRESVDMGSTTLSEGEVTAIIERMSDAWPGVEYDILRKNCVLFSDAFCVELGVGHIPAWCLNLAGAGATVCDGAGKAKDAAQAAAIMAAAKAGQIDPKYELSALQGKAAVLGANAMVAGQGALAGAGAFGAGLLAKAQAGQPVAPPAGATATAPAAASAPPPDTAAKPAQQLPPVQQAESKPCCSLM